MIPPVELSACSLLNVKGEKWNLAMGCFLSLASVPRSRAIPSLAKPAPGSFLLDLP